MPVHMVPPELPPHGLPESKQITDLVTPHLNGVSIESNYIYLPVLSMATWEMWVTGLPTNDLAIRGLSKP